MNKIKCEHCGIVNWAGAENCVRCKNKLESNANVNSGYLKSSSSAKPLLDDTDSGGFLRSPVFLVLAALVSVFLVYNFLLKSSGGSKTVNADSDTDARVVSFAVAAPPAGVNVTPPKMEELTILAQNEIKQNNTLSFQTGKQSQLTEFPKGLTKEAQNKVGACDNDLNDCQGKVESRKREMIAERQIDRGWIEIANRKSCPPEIKEDIKLRDGGNYLEFDNDIFYIVKVYADGLEGIEQNKQCVMKPAIAGLNATIYLKWKPASSSISNWQPSSQLEMQNYSTAYQKREKEEKEKIREEKRRKETDWRK